mmetsp:Transcript_15086/g.20214  ORF Transcript_15086/g.20214 Transcript_15086/m.20214 type:complete len:225 (-) Transcript_15086:375-1049(-)|eukprot:CAMPEP_0185776684 /NCGR_PEP_ID=MMETSP1174-20130828/86662_1 /TAXON_ID=35687 /ORGANISM="Dictyocha speculum, Strain CCMP1381" /LENGTH=224 /DNA_ID=CAMNT_0028464745 /DNA_START=136 /DNA_END=810 /DNA_ORIENTATION=-
MAELRESPLRGGEGGNPWVDFSVYRIPFFLEPDYPEEEKFHESNKVRLERKWGGKQQFQEQKRRHALKERGQEVGIEHFNLDRRASNTLASHRLVQWAAKNYGLNKSEALYDLLNVKHFVDGNRLNDRQLLLGCAEDVGLDVSAAKKYLEGDEGREEVLRTYQEVQRLGITGIPCYIIDGGAQVMGAVRPVELLRVFRGIEAEVAEGNRKECEPMFKKMLGYDN